MKSSYNAHNGQVPEVRRFRQKWTFLLAVPNKTLIESLVHIAYDLEIQGNSRTSITAATDLIENMQFSFRIM